MIVVLFGVANVLMIDELVDSWKYSFVERLDPRHPFVSSKTPSPLLKPGENKVNGRHFTIHTNPKDAETYQLCHDIIRKIRE